MHHSQIQGHIFVVGAKKNSANVLQQSRQNGGHLQTSIGQVEMIFDGVVANVLIITGRKL
jgi:hypothetical protein